MVIPQSEIVPTSDPDNIVKPEPEPEPIKTPVVEEPVTQNELIKEE